VKFLASLAGSNIVGFFLKGVGTKFLLWTIVMFAWVALINFVISFIPNTDIQGLFSALPPGMLYFLHLFKAPYMIAGAVSTGTLVMMINLRKG